MHTPFIINFGKIYESEDKSICLENFAIDCDNSNRDIRLILIDLVIQRLEKEKREILFNY